MRYWITEQLDWCAYRFFHWRWHRRCRESPGLAWIIRAQADAWAREFDPDEELRHSAEQFWEAMEPK